MGHLSVRVMHDNGKPASDAGVMIDYRIIQGTVEKRTNKKRVIAQTFHA